MYDNDIVNNYNRRRIVLKVGLYWFEFGLKILVGKVYWEIVENIVDVCCR